MKNNWSESLKETTRKNIFSGAMVKSENYKYGFYFEREGKVEIHGIEPKSVMPVPSAEIIATFGSIDEMIENGWVID